MATEQELMLQGHRNFYVTTDQERELCVKFCLPDAGVNEETGILLLISGFGGNSNSNVYKKMRRVFADEYNLVTLQCDYFGSRFMRSNGDVQVDIDKLKEDAKDFTPEEWDSVFGQDSVSVENYLNIKKQYTDWICLPAWQGENSGDFCEMGLLQALDNIYATLQVMSILYDNDMSFNTGKVMIFGSSHGAYLAHLCNILSGSLYTHIVDNSAWIIPGYLDAPRGFSTNHGDHTIMIRYEYMAGSIFRDRQALNLAYLYPQSGNKAQCICYQGAEDEMVDPEAKSRLMESIGARVELIDGTRVDGKIFKSAKHSLDADFLLMFADAYGKCKFDTKDMLDICDRIVIKTDMREYVLDYSNILPVLRWR